MKPLIPLALSGLVSLLLLAPAKAQNYAPQAFNLPGATLTILVGTATGELSPSGAYVLQPGGKNTYTITPLSPEISSSNGTYTYTQVSGDQGALTVTDAVLQSTFTYNLSFSGPASGNFVIATQAGTQQGSFQISYQRFTPQLAPGILSTVGFLGLLTDGSGGSFDYQFVNATNFDWLYYFGGLAVIPGTYTYTRENSTTGLLSVTAPTLPAGTTYYLNFSGSNTGTFTTSGAAQSGDFYIFANPAFDLFDVITDYTGSWYQSSWLGPVYLGQFNLQSGFIYHVEHGWWYVAGGAPNDVFVYDSLLHWLFTGQGTYPYLYSFDRGTFLYYLQGGTPALRYFFDPRPGQGWFAVTQ